MANVTELEKEERRAKVRELFLSQPSSNRNISKIAREINIDHRTVLKDIAYLRRQARKRKRHEQLDIKENMLLEQYYFELEQCENDIEEAKTQDSDEHNTWPSIASLRRLKMQIIDRIAELSGLSVNKNTAGVNISVSAKAEANTNVDFGKEDKEFQDNISRELEAILKT